MNERWSGECAPDKVAETRELLSMEREQARHRAILDGTIDAIITIDSHGRITDFNRAAEGMFGYGEDEVRGRNVSVLMPQPHRGSHDEYLRRYRAGGLPAVIGKGPPQGRDHLPDAPRGVRDRRRGQRDVRRDPS